MSSPMMCGIITANKNIDKEAIEIITEVLGKGGWEVHNNEIEFTEFYGYDFDWYLSDLGAKLKTLGYELKGSINSYSDWGDGRYDFEGECAEYIGIEDFSLYDATDEQLIEILENRGYIVTKKEIE